MTGQTLLLLGASVRALAQSCRRAGFSCRAADLFGDMDAQNTCPVETIGDYPRQFLDFAERQPAGPWVYTGGLENDPKLIDEISRQRPLWGNCGQPLRSVRDPVRLHQTLRQADLPTPDTTRMIGATTTAVRWIRKPNRSCAGANIEFLKRDSSRETDVKAKDGGRYYQAYVEGTPAAAIFVALGSEANLLGVTRQVIGATWAGAGGFQYAGSIGPLVLPDECATQIARIGQLLTEKFAMRGIFGVDGVLHQGQFWVVEVNPRYTASVEILERAGVGPAMVWHAAAFRDEGDTFLSGPSGDSSLNGPSSMTTSQGMHGKAIVYALADVRIGDAFCRWVQESNLPGASTLVADIPQPGSLIKQGQPIATVFAEGTDDATVTEALQQRCDQLRTYLEPL